MAGLFSLRMENAEEDQNLENAPVGGLDESESVEAVTTELVEDNAEIAAEDAEAEELGRSVELAEETAETIEPVITEGAGLDAAGVSLALVAMRRIAGRRYRHLVGKNINMESVNTGLSGRRETTKLIHESLKDTLKSAWAAIKAQFKKAWAKVKTWYIKTFDASKRLKARAVKVRDRAEGLSTTIDKKSFNFSSIGSIAVGGSAKDSAGIVTAFGLLKNISKTAFDTVESSKVDDNATKIAEIIEKAEATKAIEAVKNVVNGVVSVRNTITKSGSVKLDANIVAGFGDSADVFVEAGGELPGGKAIVSVQGKYANTVLTSNVSISDVDSANAVVAAMRRTRYVFSNVKEKSKDLSAAEASTLTVANITSVCDSVIEVAENIFDFKKGWENRDAAQNKLLSEIDKGINAFERDVKQEAGSNSSSHARLVRSLAGAATDMVRRDSSFKSSLVTYMMNVCGVGLTYCEASMRNYK